MPTTRTWTDEELMALPEDGFKRELVGGEIQVNPAGSPHGLVGLRLGSRLLAFVEAAGLGLVFDSSTGWRLPNGNLRVPDLSFVSRQRLPALHEGFLRVPPDLAVEILSPGDSLPRMDEKIAEYATAGVRLTWVIDVRRRRASAYRSLAEWTPIGEFGELDGEDVVPGFRCRLADVLP